MTSVSLSRRFALLATFAVSLVLAACGGSGGDGNGSTRIRALNLTTDLPSADLYTNDTKQFSALATDTLSDSVSFDANTYTINVKAANDAAALFSGSYSLSKDQSYTAIVWGRKSSLRVTTLPESEDPANITATEEARIRVLNATLDSGTVDVYVTRTDDSLNELTPTQGQLTSGTLAGFRAVTTSGTWRIRVTGTGDPSDVRLDVDGIQFTAKTYYTLVITPSGTGGVLLNGTVIAQGGAKTTANNTKARVRVVASVANNGVVSARAGALSLVSNWRSPKAPQTAGDYVQVPAGNVSLQVQVNGTLVAMPATTPLAVGSDYTLLVYGNAAAPQTSLFTDDNRVPSVNTRAKVRLVNGLSTSALLQALVSSSASGTGDVGSGQVSSDLVVPAAGSYWITVSSSDAFDPIFTQGSTTSTQALLVAQGGYTIFILDGLTAPVGRISRDR